MSATDAQIYETRTFTETETPMIELRGVSRRYSKKLDIAAKLARRLGADVREEIVHAVDKVDLLFMVDNSGSRSGGIHQAQQEGRVTTHGNRVPPGLLSLRGAAKPLRPTALGPDHPSNRPGTEP